MKLSDNISTQLISFAKCNRNQIVIPNFYYGKNECDMFSITGSDYVVEYEIKISRSDYLADFKKQDRDNLKHETLSKGVGHKCPNRFFYVVPKDLIKLSECPKYAGLIYFSNGWFSVVKSAPLLHRNKIEGKDYKEVCLILAGRDYFQRKRIKELRDIDYDKEINSLKRQLESEKKAYRDLKNETAYLRIMQRNQQTTKQ
jgi:hypothetical protein